MADERRRIIRKMHDSDAALGFGRWQRNEIRASVPQALNAHLCVGANPYIGSRRVFDDRQALAGRSGRDLST
jgi:hypothetical protein